MVDEDVTLYMDGSTFETDHGACFGGETQSVLLLSQYCENVFAVAVFVSESEISNKTPNVGIHTCKDGFSSVKRCTSEELPVKVKSCKLPAIISKDQTDVYSGLCTVLRYIVKRTAKLTTSPKLQEHIVSLLGHRLYCLKACSEVSPRTKLCELHMPDVFQQRHFNTVPVALTLFERLMNEPVVIHNMDKRQRVLLQKLSGDPKSPSPNKRKLKEIVWTKDLPSLEHVFAEGVDFSLTDICIFPAIHFFVKNKLLLKDDLPLTVKWYKRLMAIEKFRNAVRKCGVTFVKSVNSSDATITLNKDGVAQVLELADTSNNEQAVERNFGLTIRRDLPGLLKKLESARIAAAFSEYDRQSITLSWNTLPTQVHPVQGELGTLRASRKCSQIENLAFAVRSVAKDGDTIVDFCSGGGHVGIVLAFLLPKCNICLVENKEESLERARSRIKILGIENITIYQCNLEYFSGDFEIGVALHACGVATDMVIQSCIARKASFVVSPCCYGKVRNCHWISYPQSNLFKNLPLSFEESLLLGHAADKTSWNFNDKHALEGKRCMGLMDMDRANAAREHGYSVTLYTMQPPECSPKNNLLVGISPMLVTPPPRRLNAKTTFCGP